MANEIAPVNGVTKIESNGTYIYLFPLAVIVANVSINSYTQTYNQSGQILTKEYINITDKLGSADIESYCDQLALRGFFLR